MIGAFTRDLTVAYFARFGRWCQTARLVWKETKLPRDVIEEAQRERARHKRDGGDRCDCAGCNFPRRNEDER